MATLLELKKRKWELRDKMDEERHDGHGVSEETGIEYGQIIDRLQAGERALLHSHIGPWILIIIFTLFAGGCGKCMRGVGLIGEGFGDALVASGQHLQESSNEK